LGPRTTISTLSIIFGYCPQSGKEPECGDDTAARGRRDFTSSLIGH
jgi:hypothetical protein